jgi:membrane-associated phospholipid phosphatase
MKMNLKTGSFAMIGLSLFTAQLGAAPTPVTPVAIWNEQALGSIRAEKTPPPKASRALAMLHVAMHDAVNGIDKHYEQYQVTTGEPTEGASDVAAAVTAAHDVLAALYPARLSGFDGELAADLATLPSNAAKTAGIAWGHSVAAAILASRSTDGSTAVVTYIPGTGAGYWVPTPPAFLAALLPQWGGVKPFGIVDASRYVPPAPPTLNSTQYAAEVAEVKSLGSATSTTRTADQTVIAKFWANGAGTATPPGHWNEIARTVTEGSGLTLSEEARLFALLNIAMADAAIVAWQTKYEYNFWRPVTAIRNANLVPQTASLVDGTWLPLLVTPNFPEYTSGHSTFSAAASAVLTRILNNSNFAFTASNSDFPGVERSFPSFEAAAAEAGMSRIYGGIHFQSGNRFGLRSGNDIGKDVANQLLKPINRGYDGGN